MPDLRGLQPLDPAYRQTDPTQIMIAKQISITVLLLALLTGTAPIDADDHVTHAKVVEWANPMVHSHDVRIARDQDVLSIETIGTDPYFRFQVPELEKIDRDWVLEFEYFCPEGIQGLQWRSGRRISDPIPKPLPPLTKAEGWTTYTINLDDLVSDTVQPRPDQTLPAFPVRIDLGGIAGIKLQIRRAMVRPESDQEVATQLAAEAVRQQKIRLADQIREYRSQDWAVHFESSGFEPSALRLTWKSSDAVSQDNCFVIARRGESVAAMPPTKAELQRRWPVSVSAQDAKFNAMIPYSEMSAWTASGTRFQLFRQSDSGPIAMSPAVFCPPEIKTHVTAPIALRGAKGLTCITARFSPDQLRALGLQHASVNIVVSGLVSESARPNWQPVEIDAKVWWVNEPRLKHLDRDIRTACDAGAVVAGILLIPTSRNHRAKIAHPESTAAGTYAMPNLTDADSYATYRAALHVLGQRYGGGHPEFGRLDHWIVHNEVDYGWQWTNMGEQPIEVFMDHYVRSMRLVDAAVRRYNEHARVFISLTHRWNVKDDQPWKTYAPKQMLQWLINDSRIAGDFPWGVAYHPYPQSLWKADVWNDRRISNDFDTELITIKNLEVLDRFMQLETSRMQDGRLRPVICSEQGFHADETNQEQLQIQAAALLYTWRKLRRCPSIIAFDYHRPSDHPDEGGLRLGLRGLPSPEDRLGKPKPAWEVYSAIGTEHEAEMIRRYGSLLPTP